MSDGKKRRKETSVGNYYGTLAVGVDEFGPFVELENYDGVWRWPAEIETVRAIETSCLCSRVFEDDDGRYRS